MVSTNAIFVVAQRGLSAQVEIKIGIRRDEKIRFARTNSSSGNPPLLTLLRFLNFLSKLVPLPLTVMVT